MSREFLVYTGNNCQFCNMAKTLITANGDTYKEVNVSKDEEAKENFFSMGYRSVPVIFLDGKEFAHNYPTLVQKIGK